MFRKKKENMTEAKKLASPGRPGRRDGVSISSAAVYGCYDNSLGVLHLKGGRNTWFEPVSYIHVRSRPNPVIKRNSPIQHHLPMLWAILSVKR